MAGPLVTRRGAPISAAMIIASVVLPSPGGPESSTWSGALPRPRAASSTSESWSRTTRWPTNSSSRRGRSAASAARSRSSAPDWTSDSAAKRSVTSSSRSSAMPTAQGPQGSAQHTRDLVGGHRSLGAFQDGRHGVARGPRVPAEADERLDHLVTPVPAEDGRGRGAHAGGCTDAVLELQHDALRALEPDARDALE